MKERKLFSITLIIRAEGFGTRPEKKRRPVLLGHGRRHNIEHFATKIFEK